MTEFYCRIEVEVDGEIVRAQLFDKKACRHIATTRKEAIRAAMAVLEQLSAESVGGENIVSMQRNVASG